jgi:hypothetical protein
MLGLLANSDAIWPKRRSSALSAQRHTHQPPAPVNRHVETTVATQPTRHSEAFAVPTLTPDHPDYTAGMEIQGNSGPSTDTRAQYTKKWEVFKLYCETYRWNPWAFSIELATLFAAHISTRNKRAPAKLSPYLSALNHFYCQRQLGSPWVGGPMRDLAKGYEITQALAAQRDGQPQRNGSLRVAVPVSVVKLLLRKSEEYLQQRQQLLNASTIDGIAAKGTATINLCWCSIFWLMLLYGFRADTIGGMDSRQDLRVDTDLSVKYMVKRVKRQNGTGAGVLKPFIRQLPPPTSPTSLRGRVQSIINVASTLEDNEGKPLIMSLIGSPSTASDKITKAMQRILPPEETPDIAPGTFISSPSWRKTGASALATFCSLFRVKRWGMWKSTSSCERYIDDSFDDADGFLRTLFNWVNTPAAVNEDWNGWLGYDGPQDEADDGITEPDVDA